MPLSLVGEEVFWIERKLSFGILGTKEIEKKLAAPNHVCPKVHYSGRESKVV